MAVPDKPNTRGGQKNKSPPQAKAAAEVKKRGTKRALDVEDDEEDVVETDGERREDDMYKKAMQKQIMELKAKVKEVRLHHHHQPCHKSGYNFPMLPHSTHHAS